MSKLDDILHDSLDIRVDEGQGYIHDTDEAKQQIKDLMLELIGEDETHWHDDLFDVDHNLPHDGMRAQNTLRAALRQKVQEL